MRERREISPAVNATANEFLSKMPSKFQGVVATIRAEKEDGKRLMPSASLIDKSAMLTPTERAGLLDYVACLVDENLVGRSEMCIQFALLVQLALSYLGIPCHAAEGEATYYSDSGDEVFRWGHAWVRSGSEVIDGNTDSLWENPMVPSTVKIAPYWGPIKGIPGRRLTEVDTPADDPDVSNLWWSDLKAWLDSDFRAL
jgi:hypothetical protein